MVFPVKIQSFGKVELNFWNVFDENYRKILWFGCRNVCLLMRSFQLFHGGISGNASIAVISTHCRESCLFINSKKSRAKNNFSSKVFLVKLNQIQRELLEESLIPGQLPPLEPFDLTINVDHLESVEMSGRGKALFFQFLKNLGPRWFFVRITKWRPKNPVKNN